MTCVLKSYIQQFVYYSMYTIETFDVNIGYYIIYSGIGI